MSENPQFIEVKIKVDPQFYKDILQIAQYLYNFSRQTPNPKTGKLEPILTNPSVESFMTFSTKNYFLLIQTMLQEEFKNRQQTMVKQQGG